MSFMKKGKRADSRKNGKARYKEVINILEELDDVAVKIIKSQVPISKSNLQEEAEKYTDRPIGKLEESVLLSKLKNFEQALEEKRKKLHGDNV